MVEYDQVLERLRSFRPKELFRVGPERFFRELVTLVARVGGTHMNSLYLTDPAAKSSGSRRPSACLPRGWSQPTRSPLGSRPARESAGAPPPWARWSSRKRWPTPRWRPFASRPEPPA